MGDPNREIKPDRLDVRACVNNKMKEELEGKKRRGGGRGEEKGNWSLAR